ncbi:MAG: hypothetical protein OXG72_13205 [Acidobacteria bacterium]|nr:hypothetical protein [Acidobacteriota bacterium]
MDSVRATFGAGQTLTVDVRNLRVPFGWTLHPGNGASIDYYFSLSRGEEPLWQQAATTQPITGTTSDMEDVPIAWMRFRQTGGAASTFELLGSSVIAGEMPVPAVSATPAE